MSWLAGALAVMLAAAGAPRAAGAAALEPDTLRRLIAAERFLDAERMGRAGLATLPGRTRADSLRLADVLDALVESLWRGGRSGDPDGRAWSDRAVAIRERCLGPEHPDVAASLHNRANLLKAAGDYVGLDADYERVIRIRERSLGADHVDVGRALNDYANLLTSEGDYAAALANYRRALPIYVRAVGPEHRNVGKCLNNQAHLLWLTGDYAGARPLYERAVAIFEKALGPEHPNVALGLTNLANLSAAAGDYDDALSLYRRALGIHERALGAEHTDVAWNLRLLANALCQSDDCRGARALYARALAIHEKTLGPESPEAANDLAGMAEALRSEGDTATARAALERALAIGERSLGADHPTVAADLAGLAELAYGSGDYARALELDRRAHAIRERALGAEHPAVGASLARLALDERALDDAVPAFEHALRAEEIGRRHVRLTARALAERQALRYAAERPAGLDLALEVAAAAPDSSRVARAWDAAIRSRALVMDAMAERRHAVGSDSTFAALAAARARLSNLTVRGPGADPPDRYRRLLDATRLDKEALERALSERSQEFRAREARQEIGWSGVAAALPERAALVAFVRYRRWRPPAAHREAASPGVSLMGTVAIPDAAPQVGPPRRDYLAFVLPGRTGASRLVSLGDAGAIDSLVARWIEGVGSRALVPAWRGAEADRRSQRAGQALRRAVWDPLAAALAGAERVFVVPDGALDLVNLAALPVEGGYLVERGPTIHYLSAERDLVVEPAPAPPRACGLLAIGGPDYDALIEGGARAVGARGRPRAGVALRGPRSDASPCDGYGSLRFDPLPGAEREAAWVARSWRERARREPAARRAASAAGRAAGSADCVASLVGSAATEAAFKREAVGRRVLHLATHGFFLGEGCDAAPRAGATRTIEATSPLLLSGLALAGANHARERRTGKAREGETLTNETRASETRPPEDGIVTAEEIASLDLTGVEWAVLSACNTGRGALQAGEGVLGLRRAFQSAGVRTVIMSLWEVEDDAAREWMQALYAARLERGLDTAAAVREASLATLRARRARGLSTNPAFWAGFVGVGDWR